MHVPSASSTVHRFVVKDLAIGTGMVAMALSGFWCDGGCDVLFSRIVCGQ